MIVAIIGAESTGKTMLAQMLASRLAVETGLDCISVPEWLRLWCEREGRTPRIDEQAAIAQRQREWLLEANRRHAFVVADTTPLMTAVYSDFVFGDCSLYSSAIAFHQEHCLTTLLTALDVAWTADGLQRDGERVREPVDRLLRNALSNGGISWASIVGTGNLRVNAAIDALATALPKNHLPYPSWTAPALPASLGRRDCVR